MVKKSGIVIILFSLLASGGQAIHPAQRDRPLIIAVAADGDTVDAEVGGQGARSDWFFFFDEQGMLIETLENPFKQERGGAGIDCAELLAEKGATVFMAGNIGHKMSSALESDGIAFISFSGTVKEAVSHALKESDSRRTL